MLKYLASQLIKLFLSLIEIISFTVKYTVLVLVCILYSVYSLQSAICTQSAFFTLSAVCSLHFVLTVWKRYIHDIFSLWDTNREALTRFIGQANNHRETTIALLSSSRLQFLIHNYFPGQSVYKDERFHI